MPLTNRSRNGAAAVSLFGVASVVTFPFVYLAERLGWTWLGMPALLLDTIRLPNTSAPRSKPGPVEVATKSRSVVPSVFPITLKLALVRGRRTQHRNDNDCGNDTVSQKINHPQPPLAARP